jgi:hypothetical protein
VSYSVQHVRYTLECDVCGLVEKRDQDVESLQGTAGWCGVQLDRHYFCCPSCSESLRTILNHRERAAKKAQQDKEDSCEHDYQPRGLLAQCTKCEKWKP